MDDVIAFVLKLTMIGLPVGAFLYWLVRVIAVVFANQSQFLAYPFY